MVRIETGEIVPSDGEVIEGLAFVNEAAITGESAPVLKEPGTDIRSSVTGGTTRRLRLAGRTNHRQPGRDLPRPDDLAGGGSQPAEDPQ